MASRWLAVDKPLFATTVAMISLGLLMVYSSSYHLSQQSWGDRLNNRSTSAHFSLARANRRPQWLLVVLPPLPAVMIKNDLRCVAHQLG